MDKLKLLFLGKYTSQEAVTAYVGNTFIKRLLLNDGVSFLDYRALYYGRGYRGARGHIMAYVRENGINAVLWWADPCEIYYDVPFFEELRKKCFLAMILGDSALFYEVSYQYYAQAMDLVIAEEFVTVHKLAQIGVNAITHFGFFDPDQYRRIDNLPKDMDASFVGALGERVGRLEYIKHLSDNGIRVRTFGADSPGGRITLDKKIEVINKSRINLDFTGPGLVSRLTRKQQINRRKNQIKGKCLEYAMCGGFSLVEYVPGLENLFEIGKEIDVFHDKEELLEKARYYLKEEDKREAVALNGYKRARRDYDAKLTAPRLLATIDGLRGRKAYKPSEIYLDEGFIRDFTTYRVLLIIKFVKTGDWRFAFEELRVILKNRLLDWWQIRVFLIEEVLDKFPRIKSALKAVLEGGGG